MERARALTGGKSWQPLRSILEENGVEYETETDNAGRVISLSFETGNARMKGRIEQTAKHTERREKAIRELSYI